MITSVNLSSFCLSEELFNFLIIVFTCTPYRAILSLDFFPNVFPRLVYLMDDDSSSNYDSSTESEPEHDSFNNLFNFSFMATMYEIGRPLVWLDDKKIRYTPTFWLYLDSQQENSQVSGCLKDLITNALSDEFKNIFITYKEYNYLINIAKMNRGLYRYSLNYKPFNFPLEHRYIINNKPQDVVFKDTSLFMPIIHAKMMNMPLNLNYSEFFIVPYEFDNAIDAENAAYRLFGGKYFYDCRKYLGDDKHKIFVYMGNNTVSEDMSLARIAKKRFFVYVPLTNKLEVYRSNLECHAGLLLFFKNNNGEIVFTGINTSRIENWAFHNSNVPVFNSSNFNELNPIKVVDLNYKDTYREDRRMKSITYNMEKARSIIAKFDAQRERLSTFKDSLYKNYKDDAITFSISDRAFLVYLKNKPGIISEEYEVFEDKLVIASSRQATGRKKEIYHTHRDVLIRDDLNKYINEQKNAYLKIKYRVDNFYKNR